MGLGFCLVFGFLRIQKDSWLHFYKTLSRGLSIDQGRTNYIVEIIQMTKANPSIAFLLCYYAKHFDQIPFMVVVLLLRNSLISP